MTRDSSKTKSDSIQLTLLELFRWEIRVFWARVIVHAL